MLRASDLIKEISFSTSRSSGPGGQNVNKVNSRVTLSWDIQSSALITEFQRTRLLQYFKSRLIKDGVIQISSQASRSQLQNKEKALNKLDELIAKALKPVKKRKATKPSRSSKEKRLTAKKRVKDIKESRRKIL